MVKVFPVATLARSVFFDMRQYDSLGHDRLRSRDSCFVGVCRCVFFLFCGVLPLCVFFLFCVLSALAI